MDKTQNSSAQDRKRPIVRFACDSVVFKTVKKWSVDDDCTVQEIWERIGMDGFKHEQDRRSAAATITRRRATAPIEATA